MTTSFDPEKVKRGHYYFDDIGADENEPWVDAVKASDYDQLLALHKENERTLTTIGIMYGIGPRAVSVPEGYFGKGLAATLVQKMDKE